MFQIKRKCPTCKEEINSHGTPRAEIRENGILKTLFFCNFKCRGHHFYKQKKFDLFKSDMRIYFVSDERKKAFEKRFTQFNLFLRDKKSMKKNWNKTITMIKKDFSKIKDFNKLFDFLVICSLELIEKELKSIENVIELRKKYWQEENEWITKNVDETFFEIKKTHPKFFNQKNLKDIVFFLRYIEIKIKRDFSEIVPDFPLIIDINDKLNKK
jgi:hypothetical protein